MMRKSILFLLFVSCFVSAQLSSGNQTFSINGRNYDVTTPNDYNVTKSYPIVFELHSFGANKSEQFDQVLVDWQQYISVRPEGKYVDIRLGWLGLSNFRGNVWNTWEQTDLFLNNNDVTHITNIYNEMRNKLGNTFNPEKVYVYGYSNGGAMAMKMVEETNLFKAAAIRSMSFVSEHNIPTSASKIPMMFVHGTDDNVIQYNGGRGIFGPRTLNLSPKFESIKTTVQKWANHNGLTQKLEVKYLKDETTIAKNDVFFREYPHATHPLYFFVIDGGTHFEVEQFQNWRIKLAFLRMIKNPKQFGVYKLWN